MLEGSRLPLSSVWILVRRLVLVAGDGCGMVLMALLLLLPGLPCRDCDDNNVVVE